MNFIASRTSPFNLNAYTYSTAATKLYAANLECEIGKYSQWCELMNRVTDAYKGYQDILGATFNGHSHPSWNHDFNGTSGGYQLGDHWLSPQFTTYEVNCYHDWDNGSYTISREVTSNGSNTVISGDNSPAEIYPYHTTMSNVSIRFGWRGILLLDCTYNTR